MSNILYDPERLASALDKVDAEAIVVAEPSNVLYFTRYRKEDSALAIIWRTNPECPTLIVPSGNIDFLLEDIASNVAVHAVGPFVRVKSPGVELDVRENFVHSVAQAARVDLSPAGLANEMLRVANVSRKVVTDVIPEALGLSLYGVPVEQHSSLVRALQMVKTSAEISLLEKAAQQTEEAIQRTNEAVVNGVSQDDLAREFVMSVVRQRSGVRQDNVSIGRGSALGNVNQPDDIVRPGVIIRYDVGVNHIGYVSDISRCFAYGDPDLKAVQYHQALVAGQAAVLQELRPGVEACSLFTAAVKATRDSGIPHYDRTHVGHGIGLAGGYDRPLLSPDDNTVIEPGMVLCVETPYYELGFAGLQVEDMVVVTEDGYRSLTHLPRALEVL